MRLTRPLLTFCAIALATAYLLFVVPDCIRMHPVACLGTSTDKPLAPFVYRVLHPALDNLLGPNATPITHLWVDLLLQVAIVSITIPLLYKWLRQWTNEERSMIGVVMFTVVYLMAYHYYFRGISTSLEVLSVVVALLMLKRPVWWFIPLVILASLNRETSLLIVAIYATFHGRSKWRGSLLLLAIWAGITAGLHIVIGPYPHQLGLLGTIEYNLGNIPDALVANILLLPLAWLVVTNIRNTPTLLKRFAVLAGVYVLAIIVGASWGEVQRLCLPILPLLIPVMVGSQSNSQVALAL